MAKATWKCLSKSSIENAWCSLKKKANKFFIKMRISVFLNSTQKPDFQLNLLLKYWWGKNKTKLIILVIIIIVLLPIYYILNILKPW